MTNRIRKYEPRSRIASMVNNPQPQLVVNVVPPGFAVFPVHLAGPTGWQREIYRLAYEQAKAAVEIPRHHRLLTVWN
jgi:hypothetical protein